MDTVFQEIKKDKQITKFCLYGFLKNLKFFEPFLIIYLMSMDLSLFKIGILYSIREIFTYIFEIPSGIFADNYGKKTELRICFILYITSFILFFIGQKFFILTLAMIFFGLGEAFRSGTHKAMIYTYLEQKNWFKHKSFVYGRTRSYSLKGSSISAIMSIIFILQFDNLRVLFLLCIIPYILDFLLISSYPESLNEKHEKDFSFNKLIDNSFKQLHSISKNKEILKIISSSSIFDAIFKSIKDYIQPILNTILLTSSMDLIFNIGKENSLKIYLAIIYAIMYILSSIASKNVYRLNKYRSSSYYMNISFDIFAFTFILISISIKNNAIYLVVLLYFILYIIKDSRRPLFVDVVGDFMDKKERATILSIESQFRSLFLAVSAPILGLIADNFSISFLFLILGISSLLINRLIRVPKVNSDKCI